MVKKKEYGQLEDYIINLFETEGVFSFDGHVYQVVFAGKPRPQGNSGECKTDVYVLGRNEHGEKELKISIKKKSTNEFQENKVDRERAESILGSNYEQIIIDAALSIKDNFSANALATIPKFGQTTENSFKMGWKLEMASKSRSLSAPLQLTDQEVRDYIYKGTNLSIEKRNSIVNGHIISDSGVAEYLLYTEIGELQCTEAVINTMQSIDIADIEPMYLIFTANNYRTNVEFDPSKPRTRSTDGNRPLAVWVDWKVIDGKINAEIKFEPFRYGAVEVKHLLQAELQEIGKQQPHQLTKNDFQNPLIFND